MSASMGTTKTGTVDEIAVQQFIAFWSQVSTSEIATAQSFVSGLCTLLNLPPPTHEPDYMFERPITFSHGDGSSSAGRIDCYRRGHFVLEAMVCCELARNYFAHHDYLDSELLNNADSQFLLGGILVSVLVLLGMQQGKLLQDPVKAPPPGLCDPAS
ncbi:type IIL restriction-modification enzyme MmeI [Rhodoferax sp.]|uniref:type IIL restriction-modification enzyme MmeI n=1 Tax=Rhodoferax sp. TaxID=50421 RepID=UPI0026330213|nr:type IIL restriction-modification enzyme MmeI [Rhodoferax sp.]MDD2919924.1 hypothetical protein [Rhodoferax sp.]